MNQTKQRKNKSQVGMHSQGIENLMAMAHDWAKNVRDGKSGQDLIAEYLKSLGYRVSPIIHDNAKEETTIYGKNQKIKQSENTIFSPDFLVSNEKEIFFADAKWKRLKAWLGMVNVRDYDKYLKAMKNNPFGFRIYFTIGETHEIYLLERLEDPAKFATAQEPDGKVYILPQKFLKLIGHFDRTA